jgi:hypothetical protein
VEYSAISKYIQTCPCGYLYYLYLMLTLFCPVIENCIWIELFLRVHLSYRNNFTLFQMWPFNTGLSVILSVPLTLTYQGPTHIFVLQNTRYISIWLWKTDWQTIQLFYIWCQLFWSRNWLFNRRSSGKFHILLFLKWYLWGRKF